MSDTAPAAPSLADALASLTATVNQIVLPGSAAEQGATAVLVQAVQVLTNLVGAQIDHASALAAQAASDEARAAADEAHAAALSARLGDVEAAILAAGLHAKA